LVDCHDRYYFKAEIFVGKTTLRKTKRIMQQVIRKVMMLRLISLRLVKTQKLAILPIKKIIPAKI